MFLPWGIFYQRCPAGLWRDDLCSATSVAAGERKATENGKPQTFLPQKKPTGNYPVGSVKSGVSG
jgi:hypothetical protein